MDSFYNDAELKQIGFKKIGSNVKLSKRASVYMPEKISIGNNVRIDDFCCLVGGQEGINIGSYVHIAFFCIILGNGGVTLKDFSGLSSRVALYSATDDYSGASLTNPTIPEEFLNVERGEIVLEKHVIVGTNSTVLPNVTIGEGSSIGAHSLVTKYLEPWGVYVGSPVKKINERKKDLLEMEKKLSDQLNGYYDEYEGRYKYKQLKV
ncbi:acyltransferase [Peribacillus asahii]|uniref:acyltransferase n=1 Tax=Peribacillus asahii TaxID=228899 RepID=UPI0037F29A2F